MGLISRCLEVAKPWVVCWVDALAFANRQKWKWAAVIVAFCILVVVCFWIAFTSYFVVNQLLVPKMHREWNVVLGPPIRETRTGNVSEASGFLI
jgi:hypothetical protein